MSIQALTWAFKLDIKPSALKFILVSLANYTNEYGTAWCSSETMQSITGLDIKTVVKWVKELERQGYIVDTGKREGITSSIKVYRLVAFSPHPKTGKLGSSPNFGVEAHPILDNPPLPPNIDKPKLKPKGNGKSKKLTLEQWEEKTGCILCHQQMAAWGKAKNLDAGKVADAIERFRTHCMANGTEAVNFVMAFQNWVNQGFMGFSLEKLRAPAKATTFVHGSAI